MDYKNLTEVEKNQLVKQYAKLINKIIHQFYKKGVTSWDNIESAALEGFALAINRYDEERSKMNFAQYAGFMIRNNILTSFDNELRTVKLSAYAQKKVTSWGGTTFNTLSIDTAEGWGNDESGTPNKSVLSKISNNGDFSDGDIYEFIYSKLENRFSEKHCVIFYKKFGLKNYEEMSGRDIAKEVGLHEVSVSTIIKKMVNWMKKDTEICEMLQNLVG